MEIKFSLNCLNLKHLTTFLSIYYSTANWEIFIQLIGILLINGTPYSNLSAINRVVNRLTDNAGLPHCTIHGFRHTVVSILDDNGVSLQEISVLLGHENVSTTEKIYIHRNRKAKAENIDLLENVINRAGKTADAS